MAMDTVVDGRVGTPSAAVARGRDARLGLAVGGWVRCRGSFGSVELHTEPHRCPGFNFTTYFYYL